jgi:quercetin dioxygenase-like cupin family protein
MQDSFLNHVDAFLLGILDHDEEREFLAHLASGCAACQRAVTETARVMRAFPLVYFQPDTAEVATETILAGLKKRLFDSVQTDTIGSTLSDHSSAKSQSESKSLDSPQVWKKWSHCHNKEAASEYPGLLMVSVKEGDWQEIGIAGIKVKRLFVDPARDSVTMLVRMPAGASYPRHRHAGTEQCYVLEGDLHVGDITLHAGDYQCADMQSVHEVQYTEGGCLLFIVSSLHDELI